MVCTSCEMALEQCQAQMTQVTKDILFCKMNGGGGGAAGGSADDDDAMKS